MSLLPWTLSKYKRKAESNASFSNIIVKRELMEVEGKSYTGYDYDISYQS